MLLLIPILSFIVNIFIFLLSPIFHHPWCCIYVCFYCWPNLGHSHGFPSITS
jgi:hypothetical protein